MTREDIIRMAEEAGLWWQEYEGRICPDRVGAGDLEKFAQLVAAAELRSEREKIAQMLEHASDQQLTLGRVRALQDAAEQVRARNK